MGVKKNKKIITAMLLLLLFWHIPMHVMADDVEKNLEEIVELADQLTKDIFEVNWQLNTVGRQQEKLLHQLEEQQVMLLQKEDEIAGLKVVAESKREELANWLRLSLVNGRGSTFSLLLRAEDFHDFITKWYLTSKLIDYQAQLVNDTAQVQSQVEKQRQSIIETQSQLREGLAQLDQIEARLLGLSVERDQTMEVIRTTEQQYNVDILIQEQYWNELVVNLEEMLATFEKLDWEQLEPSRLQLFLGRRRALAEFRQEDIEAILRQSPIGDEFQLSIFSDGIKLVREHQQTIALEAKVSVSGNYMTLTPYAVSINNISLSPALIEELASLYDLTAPLTELDEGLIARDVWTGDGTLHIELHIESSFF